MVRKKNLTPATAYRFRVRGRDKVDWLPFSPPATARTLVPSLQQMAAPREETRGPGFVAVAWEPVEGAEKYKIEMRPQGAVRWHEVGAVSGTSVKKNNLQAGTAYHFRVKPVGADVGRDDEWAWSGWSEALAPLVLAPALKAILGPSLLSSSSSTKDGGGGGGALVPAEALAGKVVAVYCSAHWCGPCRQFTPLLAQFYLRLKAMGKPFEIVFASLDQEEEAFASYFASMPWLAFPYQGDEREEVVAQFQVQSIPRLLVFGRDGRLLEGNAVGQAWLSDAAFDAWSQGRAFDRNHSAGGGGGGGCCGGGGCGK